MKNLLLKTLPALVLATAAAQAHADWTLLGDAVVGGGMLTMTTAFNGDSDAPFNISGNSAVWIDTLEAAAGVPFHTLDLPDEPAYEGSLVTQTFTVQAGDRLSFFYWMETEETLFLDRAFLIIDHTTVFTLATRGTNPPLGSGFQFTFPTSGTVDVSFGVVDTGDFNGVSRLTVTQLAITPVPEPATWALWLAGAAGLRRLRQR